MITLIGAGNVATWIAQRLQNSTRFRIGQIYSRDISNAQKLASLSEAQAICNVKDLSPDSDFYIFALSDNAYKKFLPTLPFKLKNAFFTSGTISCQCLKDYAEDYGVIYPLQTLSKSLDLRNVIVPLCIESSFVNNSKEKLWKLCRVLSDNCSEVSELQRKQLHIAAVFACNFSNAMFSIADNILKDKGLNFNILQPLIQNTIDKLKSMPPREAQTGPAVRHDNNVINSHLDALENDDYKIIYRLMTDFIEKQ